MEVALASASFPCPHASLSLNHFWNLWGHRDEATRQSLHCRISMWTSLRNPEFTSQGPLFLRDSKIHTGLSLQLNILAKVPDNAWVDLAHQFLPRECWLLQSPSGGNEAENVLGQKGAKEWCFPQLPYLEQSVEKLASIKRSEVDWVQHGSQYFISTYSICVIRWHLATWIYLFPFKTRSIYMWGRSVCIEA